MLVNNRGWRHLPTRVAAARPARDPAWPYAELAQGWGGVGFRVETASASSATRCAPRTSCKEFVVIESRVEPDDLSPISRRYIQASARKARAAQ